MNKLFTKIAGVALGLTMAIGVGVAVGKNKAIEVDADGPSYTLTFKSGSGDGSTISSSTSFDSVFAANSGYDTYVTKTTVDNNQVYFPTATKAYCASSYGIKLGASSDAGVLKFSLSSAGQVKPTSIVVNAMRYSTSKSVTIAVNGKTAQTISSTSITETTPFTFTGFDDTITYIQLNSSKYCRVTSIVVNYNSGPTINVASTLSLQKDEKKTLSVSYSSLTANIAISQSSENDGAVKLSTSENGTYTDDLSLSYSTSSPQTIYVKGTSKGTVSLSFASTGATTKTCTVTVTAATSTIELAMSNIEGFTNAYGWYSWSANDISGQIYAYKNGDNIQLGRAETGFTGVVYNTIAVPGNISKVQITCTGTTTFNGYFSKTSAITSKPGSGAVSSSSAAWNIENPDTQEYHYFYLERTGSTGACQATKVTITYTQVDLVDPTGITIDNSAAISMDTYGFGRRTLSAEVQPFNANDKTVIWGTNNKAIVTIADGVLTAVGAGTTTVYACTSNYDKDHPVAALIKTVSVTVTQALYKKATYTPTATDATSGSDDAIEGGACGLSTNGEYSATGIKLVSGNSATFTISGYAGMKITDIDLVMSSNTSAGSGSLTVTAGSTSVLTISDSAFNSANWNGAYSARPADIHKVLTKSYVLSGSETITLAFSCSVNSLYIRSIAVRYLDYSLEQWCTNFLAQITCSGVTQTYPDGAILSDSNWASLGESFLGIADQDLKNMAKTATANKDSDNIIEQAMARYDLILRKYGIGTAQGQHTDFIGRFSEGGANYGARGFFDTVIKEANTSTIIIVIISIVGATAMGGYFLFKKKKQ